METKSVTRDALVRAIVKEVLESFSLSGVEVLAQLEAPLIAARVWHELDRR